MFVEIRGLLYVFQIRDFVFFSVVWIMLLKKLINGDFNKKTLRVIRG